jgi:hypothetical protein
MRLPIPLSLFLIAAALLGEIHTSSAQSPYSYPWCAKIMTRDGMLSCRYNSWEQCHARTGVGGVCVQSPYYYSASPGASVSPRRRQPS